MMDGTKGEGFMLDAAEGPQKTTPNAALLRVEQLLALAVMTYVMSYIICAAINIPLMDDYDAILQRVIDFKTGDWRERVIQLFRAHNEHPLLLSNILVFASYKLFGQVNFLYLTIVANAMRVMLVFVLWTSAKERHRPPLLALVLLIINMSPGAVAIWTMAALQHFGSVLLAVLTIKVLSDGERGVWVKLPMLWLAALSGGANIILIPLAIWLAITNKRLDQAIVLVANGAAIGAVVVLGQTVPMTGNRPSDALEAIKFFLTFLSGPLAKWFSYGPGIAVVLFTLWAAWRGFAARFPVYFYSIVYVIGVGLAAAWSRSNLGAEYAGEGKYSMYATLAFASIMAILYLASLGQDKWRSTVVIVCYAISITVFFGSWKHHRKEVNDFSRIDSIFYPEAVVDRARRILHEAERLCIYSGRRYIANW